MELTLQDGERFLKHSPSVIAASALAVARYTVGLPYWVSRTQTSPGPFRKQDPYSRSTSGLQELQELQELTISFPQRVLSFSWAFSCAA